MGWLILLLFVAIIIVLLFNYRPKKADLSYLPERFVIFDLETTGLDPLKHEIIEIGAIRVNRDSDIHDTFQLLIRPNRKVPKKITEITGITQAMLDAEGQALDKALEGFRAFIGDLPLVSFNSEFDMAFLLKASEQHGVRFPNQVACALKMSRQAWPGRKSYRLSELAVDGNLSAEGTHRALTDCQGALIVYGAAASRLRRAR